MTLSSEQRHMAIEVGPLRREVCELCMEDWPCSAVTASYTDPSCICHPVTGGNYIPTEGSCPIHGPNPGPSW